MADQKQSMGELFMQRRSQQKSTLQDPSPDPTPATPGTTATTTGTTTTKSSIPRVSSFLLIQQEQEIEAQRKRGPPEQSQTTRQEPRDDPHRKPQQLSRQDSHNKQQPQGGSRQDSHQSKNNRRNFRNQQPPRPIEQGAICSLRESYGFIECADRAEEMFFHFSEVQQRPDDLNLGDEVEFEVGQSSNSEKLAGYRIRVLPVGSIKWIVEDEEGKKRRGKVDRSVRIERAGREGNSVQHGMIQLEKEGGEEEEVAPLVRFTLDDYRPEKGQPSRLMKDDTVEFSLVTERRTGRKLAHDIVLIQSEKERLREEAEKKMMAEATQERGVISTLRDDYGFLRSTSRREEVYFRLSAVDCELSELVVGADMEFLVVKERDERSHKVKLSARKMVTLPKGSVQFFIPIARGVAGVIMSSPVPSSRGGLGGGSSRRKLSRKSSGGGGEDMGEAVAVPGRVRLKIPIKVEEGEDIVDVLFHVEDSPGGTFSLNRDGSQVGLWVREGDTILFDVFKDVVDDNYRLKGTSHLHPTPAVPATEADGTEVKDVIANDTKIFVRLMTPSLLGRADGVIGSLKDGFGFIHCAHRNTDVYFRLYEMFPQTIQSDLTRNLLPKKDKTSDETNRISVGSEVSFDISVATPTSQHHQGNSSHRRGSKNHTEKENLKAHRISLLPPGSVISQKVLAVGVRATVSRVHNDESGFVEMEDGVKVMEPDERHPLVCRLLTSFLSGDIVHDFDKDSIMFPDVLSPSDINPIIAIAENRGLEVRFVQVNNGKITDLDTTPDNAVALKGRLVISKPVAVAASPDVTIPNGETVVTPCIDSEGITKVEENQAEKPALTSDDKGSDASHSSSTSHKSSKRRKPKKSKRVRVVRFEKSSIVGDDTGVLLNSRDVVTCDVVQFCRTGLCAAINVRVVERKLVQRVQARPRAQSTVMEVERVQPRPRAQSTAGIEEDPMIHSIKIIGNGKGVVAETVLARRFGLISMLDDKGAKVDSLFFHYAHVAGSKNEEDDYSSSRNNKRRGKKKQFDCDANLIHKGDEVRFEIGQTEKNAKCVALNITVLSHGTLKIATKEKKICKGFILMEPSHTSLSNAQTRGSAHGAHGWRSFKQEKLSSAKEDGFILLLEDPASLFATAKEVKSDVDATKVKSDTESSKTKSETDSNNSEPEIEATNKEPVTESNEVKPDTKSNEVKPDTKAPTSPGKEAEPKKEPAVPADSESNAVQETASTTSESSSTESAVGKHVPYKNEGNSGRGSRDYVPRRGDLVSFVKGKGTSNMHAKEVRVMQKSAARFIRGRLNHIDFDKGVATIQVDSNFLKDAKRDSFVCKLSEVIGCDLKAVKEKEAVECVLHEDKIYGVCRASDLYLDTKINIDTKSTRGKKERPRLNLTVRKELKGLGGQIIAQSGMAKGPDDTTGFPHGWTQRTSPYAPEKHDADLASASIDAEELAREMYENCNTTS